MNRTKISESMAKIKNKKMEKKKLYYRLEADDYNVITTLKNCFDWIKISCGDIERENLFDEKEQPEFIITPIWMTAKEYKNLPEVD